MRRVLSIGGLTVSWSLATSLLPLLLVLAVIVDLIRPRRFAVARTITFFWFYLSCEMIGVLGAGVLFLTGFTAAGRATWLDRHYAFQAWWNRTLFLGGQWIFDMRVIVESDPAESVAHRPVLLFIRHTSVADTMLPINFFSIPLGVRLRFVLKAELQWDPCLDLYGNRLPNCFIRRGSGDPAGETARVAALAAGLEPRQGVLIYPEGTRVTARKRTQLLQRLTGEARVEAERLRHVLPVRPGGPLALLDAAPEADLWLCAHVGYEGAATLAQLLDGEFIGRTVRLRFWRVPREQIPEVERRAWLDARWRDLDAWIGAQT